MACREGAAFAFLVSYGTSLLVSDGRHGSATADDDATIPYSRFRAVAAGSIVPLTVLCRPRFKPSS